MPPASRTVSASAATTFGPTVIGGTKCPSITSTWITLRARREHFANLLAQASEVGREDRRGDVDLGEQLRARSEPPVSVICASRRAVWRGRQASGRVRSHAEPQTCCNIESPQLLHLRIAVVDIRTIVECSPQFGHTEVSSKRCRQ